MDSMNTSLNNGKSLLVFIPVLLVFNPLLITFFLDTSSTQPDTFAYIAEARNIHAHFIFNTGPWSHVDSIIILPPLYPVFIAFLHFFDISPINAALLISQLSGFLFSIFAFLYIRSFTKNFIALISVISIQLTFIYFNYFSLALTEALFVVLIMISLASLKWVTEYRNPGIFPYLLAGLLGGLVFLARELGISVIIFMTLFMLYLDLTSKKLEIGKYIMLFTGFVILVLPFYTLRYMQTGEGPLSTSYRAGNYSVYVSDQSVLDYIRAVKREKSEDYHDAYRKRRVLMQLLPDGSEMLRNIKVENEHKAVQGTENVFGALKVFKLLANPARYVNNFTDKVGILVSSLGTWLFLLSLLLLLFLIMDRKSTSKPVRIIIPGFLFIYLLVVSIFDTEIRRYVEILCPLVLLFIIIELYLFSKSVIKSLNLDKPFLLPVILAVFLPAMVTGGTPQLFYEKKVYKRNPELKEKLAELGNAVNHEPVFALFPSYAHAVNGNFRILPNDSLDKIAIYANRTDVEWLLVANIPSEAEVTKLWDVAYPWLTAGLLDDQYGDIIEYHSGFYDEQSNTDWRLYRFREQQAGQ